MGFTRKYLSADGLLNVVRHSLRQEKLTELKNSNYSWQDCLMSGLAIFGFKCPSLLQFEKQASAEPLIRKNLRTLYKVDQVPSDTCLRERLDQFPSHHLRRSFKQIFAHLQRGKALEGYQYLNGRYIISIDGTGQFSSKKIQCKNCCKKAHRKSGEVTYYHQVLGASLVHPDKKVVIPFAPEPILKSDGATKNDCERNASKRLLKDFRREHPHLKAIVVEDALASNYPHLSLLDSLSMDYIIGVKPGDHAYLFDWINELPGQRHTINDEKDTRHDFHFYHDVPLNDTHHEYRVNVLTYTETDKKGRQKRFSWVTRLPLTTENVYKVMRAGRSRWRIENETFNTLKNQGYNFEHNYGHGYEHLCSVMTMLMMLAFLIDQVQQLCSKSYQQARQHVGRFAGLFEFARSLISLFVWESFEQLWTYIGYPEKRGPPPSSPLINT
ncbi:transposase [bacterium]|nr:transposase [bacterium]